MKKYNLLKVLAITVLVTWILTLFIPASYVDYTGKIAVDKVTAIGIVGILSNLSISIQYFNGIAVLLIATACLYAVLSKVEAYNNFVSKTALAFKNKKGTLVGLTMVLFAIISALVSDWLILVVFMPFIYQVMKKLNIDNTVILSSTIVASLVGAMCNIYNSTLFDLFNLEINTLLLVKVIMLIVLLVVLIFFTAPEKEEKVTEKIKSTVKEEVKEVKKAVETKKLQVKKTTSSKKKTSGRRKV